MPADSLAVTVCTWEPRHTLELIEAQQQGIQDGTVAKLVKKHGRGEALKKAMAESGLVSMKSTSRGPVCPTCDALMESVLARAGITERADAVRDVVQDFNKAIERTRAARG